MPLLHPLTMQDMIGDGKFDAALPMLPASGYFGMAPRFALYGGTGVMSYGLVVPMAVIFPGMPRHMLVALRPLSAVASDPAGGPGGGRHRGLSE